MDNCVACGSRISKKIDYNNHIRAPSLKKLLLNALPYIDPLVPNFLSLMKRHTRRQALFSGSILICESCGHGVMESPPTQEQLEWYYQNQYWSKRSTAMNESTIDMNDYKEDSRAIHQIKFVLDQIDCKSIENTLEIGAGTAFASSLLKDRCDNKVNVHVCEPGLQWEKYYQRQNINKIASYFPFNTDRLFDYIHTSHWLEHVIHLEDTIRNLKSMIQKEKFLFVEVPNTAHFYWKLSLSDTPHIHFFTPESLKKVFEKHGFMCINMGEFGITYLERKEGIRLDKDRYGPREKGFWIRALFKKNN